MKGDFPHSKNPRIGHGGVCFKIKHDTRSGAVDAIVAAKRNGMKQPLHPYFCPDCSAWHITKMGR